MPSRTLALSDFFSSLMNTRSFLSSSIAARSGEPAGPVKALLPNWAHYRATAQEAGLPSWSRDLVKAVDVCNVLECDVCVWGRSDPAVWRHVAQTASDSTPRSCSCGKNQCSSQADRSPVWWCSPSFSAPSTPHRPTFSSGANWHQAELRLFGSTRTSGAHRLKG